jgi:hypothetical protein
MPRGGLMADTEHRAGQQGGQREARHRREDLQAFSHLNAAGGGLNPMAAWAVPVGEERCRWRLSGALTATSQQPN